MELYHELDPNGDLVLVLDPSALVVDLEVDGIDRPGWDFSDVLADSSNNLPQILRLQLRILSPVTNVGIQKLTNHPEPNHPEPSHPEPNRPETNHSQEYLQWMGMIMRRVLQRMTLKKARKFAYGCLRNTLRWHRVYLHLFYSLASRMETSFCPKAMQNYHCLTIILLPCSFC